MGRHFMPGYIPAARHKFQHKDPKKPQYSPHPWTKPTDLILHLPIVRLLPEEDLIVLTRRNSSYLIKKK